MRPSSATVRPLWVATTADDEAENTSTSSATVACLASVGLVPPFVSGAGQPASLLRVPRRDLPGCVAADTGTSPLVSPLPRRARWRPPAWSPGPVIDFGPVRGAWLPGATP